ncbi:hypothetical protein EHI8A_045390 [Entamoeba histolytica HM-1:IMSS-B]|uniref:Flavodoxin-like domain-containing protein n=6 Tax=Entamoeba histolytica TaxID=5759 RepID=C4LWQ4_ENTH1|nr:hypothetical protein EHI_198580 [Entamoeba histolytica HM-1:IMSS]EMD43057.1 Hypothetical protein EHI5A_079830 [Entamoeba histolytica KU27]EMH73009.1 hypothetical protein EHI8A_045390 [Entamoeba histolytica HM-1:IMSS-B]EMS11273.1 hypothetical protein KM1_090830 [Entamoeba histolytica HM-3:IMSS]ENY65038.1 hypothetical protein EHI7A_046030 [Entamoeba histolytica HM-1:IMSS-A]GAT93144.1 hypothetical protein CL6EHI_198580 [Entamoeba histolytica]|eukprot:XP_655197.1 hypothetical protein EHI_198580 [Entamoeba histolytica HM-1:IMSS]
MSVSEAKPILIIYFTRDGHSEKIANDIAAVIPADKIKVTEEFSRTGVGAYFTSFNEAVFGSDNSKYLKTEVFSNTEQYKAIIFIGPVWWWGLNAPIKNACNEVVKKVKADQHVFLALSFAGKSNPGDKGSYEEFAKIFNGKAIVHEKYLGCQEDYYAAGSLKDKVITFENEVLKSVGLPELKVGESQENKEENKEEVKEEKN